MAIKKSLTTYLVIVFTAFIFVSTLIITIIGVCFGAGEGQLGSSMIGIGYFKPYTIDSNVLCGIASLLLLVDETYCLVTHKSISKIVYRFFYVATTALALTFLVVLVFLAPSSAMTGGVKGFFVFYEADMFFFHFLNPILAVLTFYLLPRQELTYKSNLLAIIPTGIYSIVYLFNVAIFATWSDFYGFTFGGKLYLSPIVIIVIVGTSYLLGLLLRKCLSFKTSNI